MAVCGGSWPSGFNSSTWHECSYFSRFILEFNLHILSVVGDVSVDSEMSVMTSSISRSIRRLSLLEVLIRIWLRTCIHRDAYVLVVGVFDSTMFRKKKKNFKLRVAYVKDG